MELIIFAGGLGSRLKNTENLPKPLVKINGRSMLSIIIQSYANSYTFDRYHIIISKDEDLYLMWRKKEMAKFDINIVNETARTGRVGALKFFNEQNLLKDNCKNYALANGDTLLVGLDKEDIEQCLKIHQRTNKPTALLVPKDNKRDDAKTIRGYANSGFIIVDESWIKELMKNQRNEDIDDIIFSENSYATFVANANMIDIGTPDRLKKFREKNS